MREAGGALQGADRGAHLVVADETETSRKVDAARPTRLQRVYAVSASWSTRARRRLADEQPFLPLRRPPPRVVELRDPDSSSRRACSTSRRRRRRRRHDALVAAARASATRTPAFGAHVTHVLGERAARTGPDGGSGGARARRLGRCGRRPRRLARAGAVAPRLRGASRALPIDADYADAAEGEGERAPGRGRGARRPPQPAPAAAPAPGGGGGTAAAATTATTARGAATRRRRSRTRAPRRGRRRRGPLLLERLPALCRRPAPAAAPLMPTTSGRATVARRRGDAPRRACCAARAPPRSTSGWPPRPRVRRRAARRGGGAPRRRRCARTRAGGGGTEAVTLDLEWSPSFSRPSTRRSTRLAPLAYALPLPSFGGLKFAFTEYTGKERVLAERLVRRPLLLKTGPGASPFPRTPLRSRPPLSPPQVTTLGGEVTDAFSRDNSYLCALYQRGPKVEKARQWQQRKVARPRRPPPLALRLRAPRRAPPDGAAETRRRRRRRRPTVWTRLRRARLHLRRRRWRVARRGP